MENIDDIKKYLKILYQYDLQNSKITKTDRINNLNTLLKFCAKNSLKLKKMNFLDIAKKITLSSKVGLQTKLKWINILMIIINDKDDKTKYDIFTFEKLKEYYDEVSSEYKTKYTKELNEKSHLPWLKITKELNDKYPDDILVELYTKLPPMRDDWKNVIIDRENNEFIFKEYKTHKRYGDIHFKIPEYFENRLDEIEDLKNYKSKLSLIFKRRFGISINDLRHSFSTFLYHNQSMFSIDELNLILKIIGHSSEMDKLYVGNQSSKDDKDTYKDKSFEKKMRIIKDSNLNNIDKITFKISNFD